MNIFVYGTLRSDASNYRVLEPYTQGHQPAVLQGAMLYNLGYYPGIKLGAAPGSLVVGEFHTVADEALPVLDRFEGKGYLYDRQEVTVTLDNDDPRKAWVYTYLGDVRADRLIPSGDWSLR